MASMSFYHRNASDGDALAACVMKEKKFTEENFAKFHPGGELGRRLRKVKDEMIKDIKGALSASANFSEIIDRMMNGILGVAVIVDAKSFGIITMVI